MNKIYKVIWSKAKHTYVVASEIAKGHTKGETTGRGLKKLAAAMLVAAALMGPNFAWAAGDMATVKDTTDVVQTVYTKDGADSTFATKVSLTTEETARANADSTLQTNIDNEATNRKAADTQEAADRAAADKTLQSNIDTEATDRKNADKTIQQAVDAKANAADVYSKTDADTKFATNEQLQKDVSATNLELTKKADKATTLAGYGITDAYTKTEVDTADANLQKSIDEEARKRKYSVTNLEKADKQLQTNIDNEAAAREAEDTRLNSEIVKTNTSLNEAASNLSKLNDTVAKGFEDLSTEDKTLQTKINNEAADRKAADTALEEKVNKNTIDISGMQSDSKVSEDGSYVKTTNTVGENLTALDTGLQAEVTAREDEDNKLQSAIDEEARKRKYSVTNLEKADKQLQTNIDNEAAARKAADTKLVEAVNSGLSLSNDNVLQKNTTSVGEDGTVTTSKEAATTLVMNKGSDNQITLSDKGIKVGLNSGVMDKDGFYAGGDTADAAKAALKANGSIKGANGKFTVDADGKVTAASGKIGKVDITSAGAVSGVTDMTASGTITGNKLTDGVASLQNGNLTTTGNINAHAIVATGDISGKAITGTSLNTQGGDINGGAITGTTITGTTGTFGSLTTTGNASVGGTLSSNGLTNTGNATTDTLKVNHNATVGGDLAVTGDITGKSLNVGTGAISGGQITGTGLDVRAGTIKTTGAVETGTLETTGNAKIGGDLTVDKNLTVNGTFDAKTLSSTVDANNYTTITGGNVTSHNMKLSDVNGRTYTSTSKFNEEGRTDTAADGTTTNVSVMTAGGSDSTVSSLADENQKSYITQNLKKILQGIKNGTNESIINQTETGIKSTATDGKITASTNLSNKGFNTYVTDKKNTTYTTQTAADITNTAENGTISNTAKNLVNTASGNMTNTVGGEMKTTVTGKVTEDFKSDLTTTIGGNKSETVTGTSTETVTGKKTETYNSGLETTVTGEEKHTVNGSQTNAITGDQTNTIGGSQTTTVTGDSSLTAENINNTARNKITNKALDVETDAASSIVSKISNDYGSNTSTQLSYQTTEEMSQADGKTASYLRGAAEEKSQLTDGAKKTTIDTIAGQTNTNITEGKNVSNSLQKADQLASSVTDGTNTTVVNQDAKSLASSITDGAKANNTSSTVDASVQRIQTDDTHYSVSSKSASKMEDALFNSSTVIDSLKDAEKGLVSTAVTDGATITGISQNAKDINLSAAGGTITNDAKTLLNKASESITDKVGKNVERTMTTEHIQDKVGKTTVTTTDGLTKLTNEDGTHKTEMDFADVLKDLGVRGNATVDKKLTVKGDSDLQGNATVGKNLEVKGSTKLDGTLEVGGKSTFKDDVTMEKNLDVKGITTTEKLAVNNGATIKGGATVTGGTTTDTLHVTSTSTFDGKATFKDIVTMEKDLSVGGNATVAGDVTANSYKVGDKTYIDKDGINANDQVIRNVGKGDISEGSTDAVSGGQLYETNTRVSGLETRMGTVETRVDKLDNKIDKVGANAAAMANLHPLEFDEDSKWNIAAAVGSSGSETASAVGVFYRPNENVMVNASAAMGTGENMFGGGVSLRLGHGGNKAKEAQMKAAAAENKELRAKVDDLTARMDALLSVLNPNMSKDFPDVPENHWAYEAVSRLAGNGIVEGYEDGKYHGERQMTRYEMAEIIYNALSKGAKAEKKLVEEFRPELQAMAAQKKA